MKQLIPPCAFTLALGGLALVTLLTCGSLSGCTVGRSFAGPGFAGGRLTRSGLQTVVVTHAVLDRERREPFDRHVELVHSALRDEPERFPGLVGHAMRKELFGSSVWTQSVWTDRAALERFLQSDLHLAAAEAGAESVVSIESYVGEVDAQELPLSWARAEELLRSAQAARSAE